MTMMVLMMVLMTRAHRTSIGLETLAQAVLCCLSHVAPAFAHRSTRGSGGASRRPVIAAATAAAADAVCAIHNPTAVS